MARAAKSRALKSGSKTSVSKKSTQLKLAGKKKNTAAPKAEAKVQKTAAPKKVPVVQKKTLSEKIIETVERRRLEKEKAAQPVKVPGRRGRRPKNIEYTPGQNEDENYTYEPEFERLEYDTGIRVAGKAEEISPTLERIQEFDEELNFDW